MHHALWDVKDVKVPHSFKSETKFDLIGVSKVPGTRQSDFLHRFICESPEMKMASLVQTESHVVSEASKAQKQSKIDCFIVVKFPSKANMN